jgi:hypothetical protein
MRHLCFHIMISTNQSTEPILSASMGIISSLQWQRVHMGLLHECKSFVTPSMKREIDISISVSGITLHPSPMITDNLLSKAMT